MFTFNNDELSNSQKKAIASVEELASIKKQEFDKAPSSWHLSDSDGGLTLFKRESAVLKDYDEDTQDGLIGDVAGAVQKAADDLGYMVIVSDEEIVNYFLNDNPYYYDVIENIDTDEPVVNNELLNKYLYDVGMKDLEYEKLVEENPEPWY